MSLERFPVLVAGVLALSSLVAGQADTKPGDETPPSRSVVGVGQAIRVVPRATEVYATGDGYTWSRSISSPGASFLKPRFTGVDLRPGDTLTVRSKTGKVVDLISLRGPKDAGNFWGLSAFGDELFLEFSFQEPYSRVPFRIEEVVVGDARMLEPMQASYESICSPADFEDVVCYQGDAGKWSNVQASVGVMSVGGNPTTALFCSGSNVSPLNYVLTNDHCLSSQSQCNSTEFVFKYWRQGCNNGAPTTPDWEGFRCDTVVAGSPFISCDQGLGDLDFSLSSVIGDPAATFGHVDPDPFPITDGEDIYIIQHPAGRPHEIAHGGGANVDADGTVLRYYDTLDTEGGSSGSPIYRDSDDKLIGLHHCGGCTTPGTGNRGMLMADIYPLIQNFLCSPVVDVVAAQSTALSEVQGNGDAVFDQGETWSFRASVRNNSCTQDAIGVTARIELASGSTANATLTGANLAFGNVAAGASAQSADVQFKISQASDCGSVFEFDLVDVTAANAGPFNDGLGIVSGQLGFAPFAPVFADDFAGGGAGWAVVDGGAGTGSASTWTTANPGARSLALAAPFFIVDSDEQGSGFQMDEELISPVVDVSTFSDEVVLQFAHDFNWYSGGLDEQGDVEVRSSATGGLWVTVANFSGGDAGGTVSLDITAQAAGQTDVQVRFHYYNANFEWWWAVDDIELRGSNGFNCRPFGTIRTRPLGGGDIQQF